MKGLLTACRGRGRYGHKRGGEEVRQKCEERGEEEHAQGRGGVDGSAQPDAHVLDFGYRGLGPRTKDGLGRVGEERRRTAVDIIVKRVARRKERKMILTGCVF
jgi:hypothetical protein